MLKQINVSKSFTIIFWAGVLIMSVSAIYYLASLPLQKNKELDACLLKAKNNNEARWMTKCLSLYGEEVIRKYTESELCGYMAAQYADPIFQARGKDIDACLSQYDNQ